MALASHMCICVAAGSDSWWLRQQKVSVRFCEYIQRAPTSLAPVLSALPAPCVGRWPSSTESTSCCSVSREVSWIATSIGARKLFIQQGTRFLLHQTGREGFGMYEKIERPQAWSNFRKDTEKAEKILQANGHFSTEDAKSNFRLDVKVLKIWTETTFGYSNLAMN